jgi:RNA polymerase sigma-70 factor (ECF subfamily)
VSEDAHVTRPAIDPAVWLERHGDRLYRYAVARLRSPDAAEEVVQETFLAALQSAHQYAGTGAEGAWLMGICKRKVIDCVRRWQRPDAASDTPGGADPADAMVDASCNWKNDRKLADAQPSAAAERAEFWAAFRRCVDLLPKRQAAVFMLRELDRIPGEIICKELNISASNLWVLLHRARAGLTQCLKGYLDPLELP